MTARLSIIFLVVLVAATATAQRAVPLRSLTLVAQPKASVWIDGVPYGKTDDRGRLEIRSLSPGAKSLLVRADGFTEKRQTLTALQKGTVSIEMTATTDPGELKFQEAERLATLDREKAVIAYEEAIKLRPNYAPAYISLARVETDRSEFEKALAVLGRLKKVSPRNPEASVVAARLYAKNGEQALAIVAFKRSITEARGFQPEAYTGLGLLYKDLAQESDFDSDEHAQNYSESTKYLRTALKQLGSAPDAPIIYQLLGDNLERQKKYAEAIAVYEEFLRLFPDTAESESVRSFIVQIRKQMSVEP